MKCSHAGMIIAQMIWRFFFYLLGDALRHYYYLHRFDDNLSVLQEIQCYICGIYGHLCCKEYSDPGPKEYSCYRCGHSGHTGLVSLIYFQISMHSWSVYKHDWSSKKAWLWTIVGFCLLCNQLWNILGSIHCGCFFCCHFLWDLKIYMYYYCWVFHLFPIPEGCYYVTGNTPI